MLWSSIVLCLWLLISPCGTVKNYSDALGKSILFYDAQRSGKLPADNPISWRGDSALDDCVPGGWYDAGDHVKFGLPLSSALTLLGWGLVKFKDGYEAAGQLDMMYDMVKWGYDWMLAAWDPTTQNLVVQIGDGTLDHSYWGRPEDMTMNRPCYYANASNPGSDIAGGYVASMAAGSIAYKDKGDKDYADQLLDAAKSLYEFAKANRGMYAVTGAYLTNDDNDEMCEAAMWLYKATSDAGYLTDARGYGSTKIMDIIGWEDKMASCKALLLEATDEDQYRETMNEYFTQWFPGGQADYTPCGMAWRTQWGSARWVSNSAFLALLVAEMGVQPDKCRQWAVEQINYILGDNNHDGGCFSYEIGYGSKYPVSPHHRAASCPDPPETCDFSNLEAQTPSPHLLVGALVGGPDVMGNYADNRSDYVLNEVALDYNAGFQGALAGIVHLEATNSLPTTNNLCPCDE